MLRVSAALSAAGRSGRCRTSLTRALNTYDFRWEDFLQYKHSDRTLEHEAVDVLTMNLARKGAYIQLRDVMAYVNSKGAPLNDVMFERLMRGVVNARRLDLVPAVFHETKANLVEPNVELYNAMIKGYGKAGQRDMVEKALAELENSGVQRNVGTYSSLIKAYDACRDEKKALATYEEFKKSGIRPNLKLCCGVLQILARLGKIAKLEQAIKDFNDFGIRSDRKFLDRVALCHLRMKDYTKAEQVLEQMQSTEGMEPNFETYAIFIYHYAIDGKPADAIRTYQRAARQGVDNHPLIQKRMMMVYAKAGKPDEAEGCHHTLKRMKVQPSSETYSMLVEANAEALRLSAAQRWFEEMQKLKLNPYDRALNAIIVGHLVAGNLTKALGLTTLARTFMVKLSLRTYLRLINNLGRSGDLSGAEATILEMKAAGHKPKSNYMDRLVQHSIENGDVLNAERLLEENVSQPTVTRAGYFQVAYHYAKTGTVHKVREWIERAQHAGFQKEAVDFELLALALIHERNGADTPARCLELVQETIRLGLKPTKNMFNTFVELARRGVAHEELRAGLELSWEHLDLETVRNAEQVLVALSSMPDKTAAKPPRNVRSGHTQVGPTPAVERQQRPPGSSSELSPEEAAKRSKKLAWLSSKLISRLREAHPRKEASNVPGLVVSKSVGGDGNQWQSS